MKHVNKTAISLTLLGLMLTGCAAAPPKVETINTVTVVRPDIPPALLVCMPSPAVPVITATDPHGGSKAAALLVREYIAGADCREHLAAVAQALK